MDPELIERVEKVLVELEAISHDMKIAGLANRAMDIDEAIEYVGSSIEG